MNKALDLESLALDYATKLKEAEQAVARYQRLLESVRLLAQDQLGQLPLEVAEAHDAPRTVGQAVGLLLPRRAARGAHLTAAIRKEFPELAASVTDLQRSVAAALHYGVHKSKKYRRVGKGLYRAIEQ